VDLLVEQVVPDDSPVSPMARLPVGATFGSLVHGVLEHTDPAAPDRGGDLAAELRHHLTEQLVRWPVELDQDALVAALVAVCDTPLGPLTGELTLRRLTLADRLAELEFELPLDGGDERGRPASGVRLGDVAELLREHLPDGDPVRGYADRLDLPALGDQPLRGYLNGFIDLTLRVGGRYFVCDYKTNWLGTGSPADPGFVLRAHDYAPTALADAMGHSDYPLQALLYSLVLHRYLRWRQPGYDPDQHLGGVLYLYLRGMCGPDTPVVDGHPCGVFSWRPPAALVTALSDLVDGRVTT
jgi:exodeoxyribonuclease V beta subunit